MYSLETEPFVEIYTEKISSNVQGFLEIHRANFIGNNEISLGSIDTWMKFSSN